MMGRMVRDGAYGVYLRQSLDAAGNLLAIDRQRPQCMALAADRGIEKTVEYVDNDISALTGKRSGEGKGTRPAYDRMVADIEAGKIVGVIALDLDRLYRLPVDLEHLIDLAERDGLVLLTCGGDADLSTDSGRLFARIKAAVAKAESERKSARHKLAHQQRADAGTPWGNRRPFGYTADYEPHPVEAPLVRAAYADVIAGVKLAAIEREWNAAGITTTLGREWKNRLNEFLTHPRNAGHCVHLGEITKRDAWPALVDEPTWLAAHSILTASGRNPRLDGRARKYLLTGIVRCGLCKETLGSGQTSRGVRMYLCRAKGCGKIGRKLEAVDDLIERLVCGRLAQPDAAELIVDRKVVNLDELRAAAAAAAKRMTALAEDYADGEITREQLRAGTTKLRRVIADCDAAMADSQRARIFEGLIGTADVRAAWDKIGELPGGLDRQRAVVKALMVIDVMPTRRGSRFDPEAISVEWVSP